MEALMIVRRPPRPADSGFGGASFRILSISDVVNFRSDVQTLPGRSVPDNYARRKAGFPGTVVRCRSRFLRYVPRGVSDQENVSVMSAGRGSLMHI